MNSKVYILLPLHGTLPMNREAGKMPVLPDL